MTGTALTTVLAAAFLHAGWNYLAKTSRNKLVFIWQFLFSALIIYLPMFLYYWPKCSISFNGWVCIAMTGLLHFLYFRFLGGAYERGDLSLVYPLSRGAGPIFVPILALLFIHEKLSVMGSCGIALVVSGIYIIHLRSFSRQSFLEPVRMLKESASVWALCTGGTIAAYSIVDKIGVSLVDPPVYIYLMLVITLVLLTPFVLKDGREPMFAEWRANKKAVITVGFLVLGTYLMILFAFQIAEVSYVVAVREISILFSVFYGIFRLKEKYGRQKFVGAVFITCGVVFIGLAR